MGISPEEMFRKLAKQEHIQGIMSELGAASGEEIVSLTPKDLVRMSIILVETCLNLMIFKGITTPKEVQAMALVMREAFDELFIDGDDQDGEGGEPIDS